MGHFDRTCSDMRILGLFTLLARQVQSNSTDISLGVSPRFTAWGSWGAWSECSQTRGEVKQKRSRTCIESIGLLFQCNPGSTLDQTQDCANPCCNPEDGSWTTWSQWSGCSVSCNSGQMSRKRTCTFPTECRGISCEGDAQEGKICNLQCCNPVDGYWSAWNSWSDCSGSCGLGKKFRNHTCLFASDCQGDFCGGPAQEENKCDLPRPTSTGNSSTLLGASITGAILLIVVVVALLIRVYKMGKRRGNLQQQPTKVEDNPLYGTYGVNGDQNDYTTVQDTNDYYF